MAETIKKKKTKRAKAEQERTIKEEAVGVIRPGKEGKGVQQEGPREGAEEARVLAAEMPQEEVAPEERPPVKGTILMQCMTNPSFRTQVIHHLVKKLR